MAKKLTTEDFLIRAREIHGNRYGYSLVKYRDTGTPVVIICRRPEHGEFNCSPRNHLRSVAPRGCPKCGRERQIKSATKPFDQFVAEARTSHGKRYRYLANTYEGARANMTMVCEKHGQFQQSPDSHLRGAGCLKCANETRGGKYRDDYARAVAERVKVLAEGLVELDIDSYKGQNIEANFTCKLHGDFTRRAIAALMTSHPCPECARAALGNYPSDGENLETVMLLALGAGYTVEPFQYDGRTTEVTLWCGHSMHPPFQKIVYNIKKLRGCSICSKQLAAQKRKETMEWLINSSRTDRFQEWLVAAIEIHGAKFDYSQVDYQTARVKVKIICPSHGSFWQAPGIHLNGGCRKCADADLKGRYSEVFFQKYPEAGYQPAILYYLRFQFGEVDFYKVGITINDVAQRHSMLNTLSGLKFEALAEAPMTLREAYDAEQSIQGEHGDCSRFEIPFPKDVQRGIRIGPSECFQQPLTKEILSKYFK